MWHNQILKYFSDGKQAAYPSKFPYPIYISNSVGKDLSWNLQIICASSTKFNIFLCFIDKIYNLLVPNQQNLQFFGGQSRKFFNFFSSLSMKIVIFKHLIHEICDCSACDGKNLLSYLTNEIHNFSETNQQNLRFFHSWLKKFAIFSCQINKIFNFSMNDWQN